MAAISTTQRNAFNSCSTTLKTSLSSGTQTTGIVLNALIRNGVTVSWPATGGGILRFYRGSSEEHVGFGSATVDATTKEITLVDVTRDLPWNDGTSFTTAGSGIAWPAGTRVDLVLDARHMNFAAFKDLANTFTAAQTFSGLTTHTAGIVVSGSTSYVKVPSLTTAQRTSLSASNGMIVYDSDLAVLYQYIGGSWSTFATGSVVAASDGTAGKVDLATAAEVAAGTATDASSGASNVIPVAIVKPNSTGAVSGTVPALNTSVALDRTIGGLGTVTGTTAYTLIANGTTATGATQNLASAGTSGQHLISNGAAALPTFQTYTPPVEVRKVSIVDSAAVGTTSTAEANMDVNYTIVANDWAAGCVYNLKFTLNAALANSGGTDTMTIRVKLGTTAVITFTAVDKADGSARGVYEANIVCRSVGAGGTVQAFGTFIYGGTAENIEATNITSTTAIDTTASQVLQVSAQYNVSNGGNTCNIEQFIVTKLNP